MTDKLNCFHCGEEAKDGMRWSLEIDGQAQPMCCPACRAVADTIIQSGLKDYYKHRTALPEISPSEQVTATEEVSEELKLYDSPELQKNFVANTQSKEGFNQSTATLVIDGISCAACSWLIEHRLSQIAGVESATLNLTNHRLVVSWKTEQLNLSQILAEIQHLGYQGHPFSASQDDIQRQKEGKIAIRRLMVAGVGMMQTMMFAVPLYQGAATGMEEQYKFFIRLASLVFATAVISYSSRPFFTAAIRDLKARHLTMDVPVSLAILLAFFASVWSTFNNGPEIYFDSVCMFTFFLLTGRYLEMRARHRMSQAGNNLLDLLPSSAIRLDNYPSAPQEHIINASDIDNDDILLIKPGQQIPADGEIIEGQSSIDEAALTGEYLPVSKTKGERVIGGTHNIESPLTIKVTASGANAQLSTIMQLLDRAQQEKPAIALFADKVASRFVAAVLIISSSVGLFWYFHSPEHAFWIALSVLVVTCPCALSLATPTALTSATAALREKGLLISKGHVLEGLNQIDRVVFDKTGTLTQGRMQIAAVASASSARFTPEQERDVINLAAALEQFSNHPLAKAFIKASSAEKREQHIFTDVIQHPAQGIEGYLSETGEQYFLGHAKFVCDKTNITSTNAPQGTADQQWILFAKKPAEGSGHAVAWFALTDTLRSGAKQLVDHLHQQGIKTAILTGDPSKAVEHTAELVGISDVYKALSPEQKLEKANHWQQDQNERLLMIGDGINDVPTLAGADLSIAVSDASDLAKTNADALLTNGRLDTLIKGFSHAARTQKIIKQNIAWALIYNLIALPLAAAGYVPPWAAAIGMSFSSLLVVLNALRLLK